MVALGTDQDDDFRGYFDAQPYLAVIITTGSPPECVDAQLDRYRAAHRGLVQWQSNVRHRAVTQLHRLPAGQHLSLLSTGIAIHKGTTTGAQTRNYHIATEQRASCPVCQRSVSIPCRSCGDVYSGSTTVVLVLAW